LSKGGLYRTIEQISLLAERVLAMAKKEKHATNSEGSERDPKEKSPNIQLISVILGFVGTVLTVLATVYGPVIQERLKEKPTSTPIVIVSETRAPTARPTSTPAPTDTVPPGEATSTPAPTETPVPPTATAIPIGSDWLNGCISSLWVPYPASLQTSVRNGCYSQPLDVFYAQNGRLSFLYDGRLSSAEVHGLFAPLPASGTVELQVYLRELKNGNLWMGVFSEPSLSGKGLLMTIPAGDVKRRPFAQWLMPGPEKVLDTVTFQQSPAIYSIRFNFNALSVNAVVMKNAFATSNVPVQSEQKWLFLGFQGMIGTNRLEAEFFDLKITP
jgi:hypothetical protein